MSKINKDNEAAMPQKSIKELLQYNELNGGWVWIKKPHPRATKVKVGQPAGSANKVTGYITIGINNHNYYAHRLAWTYIYGDYPDGEQPLIDHINGNPSDNRIVNLRCSSSGENNKNKQIRSDNTSGVVGVNRREKVLLAGKIYAAWVAYWYNENGKLRTKSFNIEKLGEDEARQMATDYRNKQIRLLELNHGITYSERHRT